MLDGFSQVFLEFVKCSSLAAIPEFNYCDKMPVHCHQTAINQVAV